MPTGVALAGPLPRGRFGFSGGAAGVRIAEPKECGAALIVARKGLAERVASQLSQMFGVAVADAPRRSSNGHTSITGVGPGQWLVVEEASDDNALVQHITPALSDLASISAQGNGRFSLHLSGPKARATLAKGFQIDLHQSAFRVGDAAQTVTGHMGVGIALIDDVPTFEIVSAASTRASFLTWLLASAAEFGVEVV